MYPIFYLLTGDYQRELALPGFESMQTHGLFLELFVDLGCLRPLFLPVSRDQADPKLRKP